MVKAGMKMEFNEVTDRICMITKRIEDRNHTLIYAYVSTLLNSEKKPEIRDKIYKDLESVINDISKRKSYILLGISKQKQDLATRTTQKM